MTEKKRNVCLDCFPDPKVRKTARECTKTVVSGVAVRPAPHKGPRCATHHREVTETRKKARHAVYVGRVYGLEPGDYDTLYEAQGGRCALCRRATGASRKLSVDHDHKTGLVRGELCMKCNDLLGHARDDVEFFRRAIDYLLHPPALQVLGERYFKETTHGDSPKDRV